MTQALDFHTLKALLEWQIDLGATEAIGDAPINRFEAPAKAPQPIRPQDPAPQDLPTSPPAANQTEIAQTLATQATDLVSLRAALVAFDGCDLKKGARNLVFADGNPAARVMVIGEAPGREEDLHGRPFVGAAGQLLDKMFAAIGLSRGSEDPDTAIYITNILPWRPPQNREPTPQEIAMLMPFVAQHINLAAPQFIIAMGNTPCAALLGQRGITRLRGTFTTAFDRPVLPMLHPAYLLRNPIAKRDAWSDLLTLKARMHPT